MSSKQHYFDHVREGYNDDGFGARAERQGGGSSSPWATGAGSGAGRGAAACPGIRGATACLGIAGAAAGAVGGNIAAGITGTRRRRKSRFFRNTRPAGVLTRYLFTIWFDLDNFAGC
jgi:hypothetical protein